MVAVVSEHWGKNAVEKAMKIPRELRWELYLVKRFGAICDDVINWKDGLMQPQVEIRYCMNVIGNWRIEQVN